MSTVESQLRFEHARRIVLMGVSGSGKTSVGTVLGERIGAAYVDGDDLHPAANVAKMSRGEALTDADRGPWLSRVGETLDRSAVPIIIGCSALKRAYRDHIRRIASGGVIFVHLSGSRELIGRRMAARSGHFMPESLLDNQFATLEPPGDDERAITVDIGQEIDGIVARIAAALMEKDL
jgi:gluconokinase